MTQPLQALGGVTLHVLNPFKKPLISQKMMGERTSDPQEGTVSSRNACSGFLVGTK